MIARRFKNSLILTGALLVAGAPVCAQGSAPQRFRETVSPLPAPTGAALLGTTVAYLTDSSRTAAPFASGRPVTVQLWYPAARSEAPRARYLFERALGAELLRVDYYGLDSAALRTWATLRTHARIDAPASGTRHPFVAISVGQGLIRANYSALAEDLASHGYVVAMIDSPLQGLMVLPDGRAISDTLNAFEAPAALRGAVIEWARDISFVLTALQGGKVPGVPARVAATVDWSKVGALGHSVGGLVAIATCETDRRVYACANLDGGVAAPDRAPLADFVAAGITTPALFLRSKPLYGDADFARRGITRQEWEKRGEGGRIALDSLVARSRGPLWMASVAGTGHLSFSDAPFVMPTTISRFGGKVIDPKRGLFVIASTLRSYFDQELSRWPDRLDLLPRYFPELGLARANP
jgi:pimeloyl-ACP methyl ester carboxylesterase